MTSPLLYPENRPESTGIFQFTALISFTNIYKYLFKISRLDTSSFLLTSASFLFSSKISLNDTFSPNRLSLFVFLFLQITSTFTCAMPLFHSVWILAGLILSIYIHLPAHLYPYKCQSVFIPWKSALSV